MANKHDSELTPQQVKQNGLGRRGAPVREQRPASRRPRGRYTLRQNIRVLEPLAARSRLADGPETAPRAVQVAERGGGAGRLRDTPSWNSRIDWRIAY